MKALLLIILLTAITFPQNNPSKQDTLIYRTGEIIIGEVKLIKETTIDFLNLQDGLTYEIKKSSIGKIILKSGKEIQFLIQEIPIPVKDEDDKWNSWERNSNADGGTDTCLIIGGTAGLVIVILAIIGALVQD